jgi:ATP-dependent exoDNAse (exonuclease V) beta subunit
MVEDRAETGYIDLLYHNETGWHVVDFKTDSIRSAAEQQELVSQYRRQMNRYADAVAALLGKPSQVKICFLDNNGSVGVVEI